MHVLYDATLPESIQSVSLNHAGDRALLLVGDQTLRLSRVTLDGQLDTEREISLPTEPYQESDGAAVCFDDSRAAFFGEEMAVLTRQVNHARFNVAAIDLRTGEQIADAFPENIYFAHVYGQNPIPISPRHVLISTPQTALCLEMPPLREVFRIRTYEEEEEEQIAGHGVAWNPSASTLHVLWRVFNENSLQGYHLDLERETSSHAYRRTGVCADDGAGLCLNPDGSGLTAMVQTMDDTVLFGPDETEPPRLARLGFLLMTSPDGEERKRIPLESELRRDFAWGLHHRVAEDGQTLQVAGYRFSAEDLTTQPIYIDPERVVIGTPGGLLLQVDIASGTSEIAYDLGGSISSLEYHSPTRRLFAACEGGRLTVLRL